jgi:hypothetical protein
MRPRPDQVDPGILLKSLFHFASDRA